MVKAKTLWGAERERDKRRRDAAQKRAKRRRERAEALAAAMEAGRPRRLMLARVDADFESLAADLAKSEKETLPPEDDSPRLSEVVARCLALIRRVAPGDSSAAAKADCAAEIRRVAPLLEAAGPPRPDHDMQRWLTVLGEILVNLITTGKPGHRLAVMRASERLGRPDPDEKEFARQGRRVLQWARGGGPRKDARLGPHLTHLLLERWLRIQKK